MMSDTKTYDDGYEDGYNAGVADAKAEAFTVKDAVSVVDAVLKDLERFADGFLGNVREVTGPASGMTSNEIEVTTAAVEMFSKAWIAVYRKELNEKFGESND